MQFGIGRATTFEELADDARWAEKEGFAAVCLSDHFLRAGAENPALARVLPASDPFVSLAGLARETTRIELVVMVSAVTFRHPAVVLKSTIDLDHISNGRFVLGVGAGYRESEHEIFGVPFPPLGERYELLEEHLGYLRAGLSIPNPGFEGAIYRLGAHPICPAPTGRVRLLVGGKGPRRTPSLAGRFADEYNIFPMGIEAMRARIARAREACASSGRDPELLTFSSGGPIISGSNRAEYRAALAEPAKRVGMTIDELDRDHRDNQRLVGTHEELAERLQGFADVGISRFYVVLEGEGALDRQKLMSTLASIAPQ